MLLTPRPMVRIDLLSCCVNPCDRAPRLRLLAAPPPGRRPVEKAKATDSDTPPIASHLTRLPAALFATIGEGATRARAFGVCSRAHGRPTHHTIMPRLAPWP